RLVIISATKSPWSTPRLASPAATCTTRWRYWRQLSVCHVAPSRQEAAGASPYRSALSSSRSQRVRPAISCSIWARWATTVSSAMAGLPAHPLGAYYGPVAAQPPDRAMTQIFALAWHETRRTVRPSGDETTPMSKERHSPSMSITEYLWGEQHHVARACEALYQ